MKREFNVSFRASSSRALNPQSVIDPSGFPFTCNPTIGCHFGCSYCYSFIFVKKQKTDKRKDFYENVIIKEEIPALLEKELEKYSVLPQHLKRVQLNETSDYYLPRVIDELRNSGKPDIMYEILDIFHRNWNEGNKWMLHLLTKSPLIKIHLDKLKAMRHMVQVEISFATADEKVRRQIEISSPSTQKRLDTIKLLSGEGIFVRVMAMPFYGSTDDLVALKDLTFQYGARAFKNKGLNYFSWDEIKSITYEDLVQDKISRVQGRKDEKNEDLIIKSGENYMISGTTSSVKILMPNSKNWAAITMIEERLELQDQKIINCGYTEMNSVDWGYIR